MGSVLSIFRVFRGGFEGLWPFFVGRKATELSEGNDPIIRSLGSTGLVTAGSEPLKVVVGAHQG